jgi:phosphoglycolate phosphatase-like HAD superfamily hydrolase
MKFYKHVISDFDGVLADSLEPAMREFNRIRRDEFPQLPEVSGRDDMTIVYGGSLRTALRPWLTEAESRRFFDLHSAAMAKLHATVAVFDGVGELLSALGPGQISIVTSAYSDAVRSVLSRAPGFDPACISQIAGRELRQSKTKKITDILHDLGIEAAEAVCIGDLESDVIYCRNVPIDIIGVGYGYHPAEHLANLRHGPTYLVNTVKELGHLLQQHVQRGI